jgi:hypothetical protein
VTSSLSEITVVQLITGDAIPQSRGILILPLLPEFSLSIVLTSRFEIAVTHFHPLRILFDYFDYFKFAYALFFILKNYFLKLVSKIFNYICKIYMFILRGTELSAISASEGMYSFEETGQHADEMLRRFISSRFGVSITF